MTRPPDTQLRDLYIHLHDDWPAVTPGHYVADDHGRLAFRAHHDRAGPMLCTFKSGLHGGQCSFMHKPVRVADREHRVLVQFLALPPTADTAYAFDPETVRAVGTLGTVESPKGVTVEAIHVRAERYGEPVGAWLRGAGLPQAESRETDRGVSLREYGVKLA